MNFNKCKRCGCFFVANGDTCPVCTTKDNYFSENENTVSINDLSSITGISTKNLTRYVNDNNFNFKKQIKL